MNALYLIHVLYAYLSTAFKSPYNETATILVYYIKNIGH